MRLPVDVRILNALRAAPEGVSGAELSGQLGLTRAAVWAHIEELRRVGYGIEASPHTGYRLASVPDLLHADDLLSRLGRTTVIGRDIRVFQETASTNDVADKLARDGVAEGVVIFAESQTRGRGRLGRQWLSPPRRGLWGSVLLRPRIRPQSVTQLTVLAAVSLLRALRAVTGLNAEVKWPNDVQWQGRKLAGILTEMSGELDSVRHVILGIGVDVNQSAGEFPAELRARATSVRLAVGRVIDRAELATALLRELDRDYLRWQGGAFEQIADEWESACTTLGHDVAVEQGGRRYVGRAESLDPDGALLLRTAHGHLERISGGDVTLQAVRT